MIGNVQKSVTVLSDDPSNPNSQLTFEAFVIWEIIPSTPQLMFSEVPRDGLAVSQAIRLFSGNGRHVVVSGAKFKGASYLSCDTQKEGNDMILNVSINGRLVPKKKNAGSDILHVRTKNKKAPKFGFLVHWEMKQFMVASPEWVSWIAINNGEPLRTEIHIKHPDGKPFKILSNKSSTSQITVTGLNKKSATEHKFEVVLSVKAGMTSLRESLTLKLDCPEQPFFEVPISVVLQ